MRGAGAGDKLARGGVRATYLASEKSITAEKWARIFDDFEPDEFARKENASRVKVAGAVKETSRSKR
jgi:hypothetical protein